MKISHEEYLKQQLFGLKTQLRNLRVEYQVMIAESNVKREMLDAQIASIERQLGE